MASPAEKGRYSDAAQRRLYPLATVNSATARPLSAAFAAMRLTPNAVSVLSLLVSLGGCVMVATGRWTLMWGGALLVHLGLVLDHADGQVARRRGMGSTWGMYLDMAIDRVVEIAIVVAAAAAVAQGPRGLPSWLPAPWAPLGALAFVVLCCGVVGAMMLWRFLTAYNDLLYLRTHMAAGKGPPAAGLKPKGLAKRPLVPFVFTRDWVLLIWVVGVVAGQLQPTVVLLGALHVLSCVEKMVVFRLRHADPEADAARILGRDYH